MAPKAVSAFVDRGARALHAGARALARFACCWLLGVVALNVAARALFDATGGAANLIIPGALEQASLALAALVFAAAPASLPGALVRVEILIERAPRPLTRALEAFWRWALALFAATLALVLAEEAAAAYRRGALTQDLEAPLALVYGVLALECAAFALLALYAAAAPARAAALSDEPAPATEDARS